MTVLDQEVREYRDLARRISRRFFARELAFDRDDMEQEALIAVWEALEKYSAESTTPRRYFVAMVVRRRLVSLVRAAKAEHQQAHGAALRAAEPTVGQAIDHLPGRENPARHAELITELRQLKSIVQDHLSPLERAAVLGLIEGQQLQSAGKKNKQLDNARQRAKKKLAAGGSLTCPDCGHTWERHDPNGGYASFVRISGGCSVRRCTCKAVPVRDAA